jgi:hypothetical protein
MLSKEEFNYKNEIFKLKRSADNSRGIEWKIKNEWLSREFTENGDNLFAQEDYAQQILNLYRAVNEIIDIENPFNGDDLKSQVNKLAKQKLKDYTEKKFSEDAAIRDLKTVNSNMVAFLKEQVLQNYNQNEVNKVLRLAEAYAGLNDDHYNIQTITKIGDKTFIQRSEKLSALTNEQKQYFENRKEMDWYKSLTKLEQGLVEKHLEQITDGKHVISCIIRNIPGVRNAYKKMLVQIDENQNAITLNSYVHSAGINTFNNSKFSRTTIPTQNYEQLKQNIKSKDLKFLTLVSELPFGLNNLSDGFDQKIVKQTKETTGKNFINIPINVFRGFSQNNYYDTYLKSLLKQIQEKHQDLPAFNSYLGTEKNFLGIHDLGEIQYKKAISEIEKTDKHDKGILKEIVELKKLAVSQSGFLGRVKSIFQTVKSALFKESTTQRNDSVGIASSLVEISSHIDPDNPILVSCKSGKDRTGYISYQSDVKTIKAYNPKIDIKDIQTALSQSSHVQFIASCGGGKTGCFGIKKVQIDGDQKSQNGLFARAASNSSHIELIQSNRGRPTVQAVELISYKKFPDQDPYHNIKPDSVPYNDKTKSGLQK